MRNLILFITIMFSGIASSQTFNFNCTMEVSPLFGTEWTFVEDENGGKYYNPAYPGYAIETAAIDRDEFDAYTIYLNDVSIFEDDTDFDGAIDFIVDDSTSVVSEIRYVVENRHENIERVVFNISTYEFIGDVRQPEDNPLRLSFSTFIASKTQGSFTLDWGGFEYRVVRIPNGKYQIRTIQGEDLTTPGFVADATDSATVVEYILNNY